MPVHPLLVLLSKATLLLLFLLSLSLLLLYLIGLSHTPPTPSPLHRRPHTPPPYNQRTPTTLTPPIALPPRRLSFSATTPHAAAPAPPRPAAAAPSRRRVTFHLTPSQESNERRAGAREGPAAPYRSPGPEVRGAYAYSSPVQRDDDDPREPRKGELAERDALVELYPVKRRAAVEVDVAARGGDLRGSRGGRSDGGGGHVGREDGVIKVGMDDGEKEAGRCRRRRHHGRVARSEEPGWRAARQERLAGLAVKENAGGVTGHARAPPRQNDDSLKSRRGVVDAGNGGVLDHADANPQPWVHPVLAQGDYARTMSRFEKKALGLAGGDARAGGVGGAGRPWREAAAVRDVGTQRAVEDDVSPPSIIPLTEGADVAAAAAARPKETQKKVRFSLEGNQVCTIPTNSADGFLRGPPPAEAAVVASSGRRY